jgi:hypothetical protein
MNQVPGESRGNKERNVKRYIKIHTITLIGHGFSGYNGVWGAPPGARYEGFRALEPGSGHDGQEPVEGLERALDAAEAVFKATGAYPGHRFMTAVVRVDGGRAVVCKARGRRGW